MEAEEHREYRVEVHWDYRQEVQRDQRQEASWSASLLVGFGTTECSERFVPNGS